MSDEVIKILDTLTEKFGLAVDWSSSNVLPYFQQLCNKYVRYEITTSIIWIVIGIALLLVGRCLLKKGKYYTEEYKKEKHTDYNEIASLYKVGAVFIFFIGGLMIIMQIFDIATCITFPEKMIFRYLQNIYNSCK